MAVQHRLHRTEAVGLMQAGFLLGVGAGVHVRLGINTSCAMLHAPSKFGLQ